MKFFIQNISNFILAIADNYTDNLKQLAEITKNIRAQAQDYYEKYKALNKDFINKRRELKSKTELFNEKIKLNLEENENTKKNMDDYNYEYKFFKEKMNIENSLSQEKEDIKNIAIILDSLVQDVNIFEGLEEEDALLVSEALNEYLIENKSINMNKEKENIESDAIVEKIKIIVNELNEKKKINLIEMKYSENGIFSFGKKSILVSLKDNNIYGN